MNEIEVVVATIGRAHGLKGEVSLILRTDQPAERLRAGSAFAVGERTVTITSTRIQQGRWYARFAEVTDRTHAESLRGTELVATLDRDQEAEEDPDAWYPDELRGLTVRHLDGTELGTVVDLLHYPAQDVLVVRTPDQRRVMLPFVEELVPEVGLDEGVVLADPPGGLFEERAEDESEQGRS
jgi:16S rRNA processing protein RimM